MRYIFSHWRGTSPLSISLWINLIGLTALVSVLELSLISHYISRSTHAFSLTLASLFVTRLVIFPWQLVGLFRSIERNFLSDGSVLRLRVAQMIGLLSIVFTLVYALEVVQAGWVYQRQQALLAVPDAVATYTLTVEAESHQLEINGNLDYGITEAVAAQLELHPGLTSVVLNSPGGEIYEGRGLARLFMDNKLDTYVHKTCSSACTTAFIGGGRRYLGPQGKLGFHQYRTDRSRYRKAVLFFDPVEEQQRDLRIFQSRGVTEGFLKSMYRQSADGIWFPDRNELLDAKVIHPKEKNSS